VTPQPLDSLLDVPSTLNRSDHILADELVKLLDVRKVLARRDLVPEIDHHLARKALGECRDVLGLAYGPAVVLAVIRKLLDKTVDLAVGHVRYLSLS
jgi:hypothetical protein